MLHSFKAEMSHFVYLGHYVGNTMMRDALASHITQRFAGIVEIVMGHGPSAMGHSRTPGMWSRSQCGL